MGEVWLLESASGGLLAAKFLDADADHEARKRFLREAQLALGVKHPNLVETYDVGQDPETGLCYILMEYVPGRTLADEGWNGIGYMPELNGRRNLCCTLPGNSRKPVKFRKNFVVPQDDPKSFYSIRKTPYADAGFKLEILVDGKVANERRIDDGDWVDESFDLSTWKGKKIQLEIRQSKLPDLKNARASWARLQVR